MTGHGIEAQFPLGIALAAIATHKNQFYGPLESSEDAIADKPENILVTTVGHYRAEGLGLVKPVVDQETQQ